MTNDLDMAGLSDYISQEKAGTLALQAGNDLILSSSYAIQIPEIIKAVQQGKISMKDINQSFFRILAWKERLTIL